MTWIIMPCPMPSPQLGFGSSFILITSSMFFAIDNPGGSISEIVNIARSAFMTLLLALAYTKLTSGGLKTWTATFACLNLAELSAYLLIDSTNPWAVARQLYRDGANSPSVALISLLVFYQLGSMYTIFSVYYNLPAHQAAQRRRPGQERVVPVAADAPVAPGALDAAPALPAQAIV
ncbi:MAG: hypothetical protein ABGY11_11545 [Candidatus Thioglobus sp.]